jgi:hypothetical protein
MRNFEALKIREVQRGKKRTKMHFVSWKVSFSYCYCFITPFHLQFKDDFKSFRINKPLHSALQSG